MQYCFTFNNFWVVALFVGFQFGISAQTKVKDSIESSILENYSQQKLRLNDAFKIDSSVLDFEENLALTQNYTVVTAEDIFARGYDNLDEVLRGVPGLYLSSDGQTSQIGIHGMNPTGNNNSRIAFFLDNIPLNDPLTGAAPSGIELRAIPIEDVQEVRVYRSPMNTCYGEHAMLGVVKIKMKKQGGIRANYDVGSYGKRDFGLKLGYAKKDFLIALNGRLGALLGQDIFYPQDYATLENADSTNYRSTFLSVRYKNLAFSGGYQFREGKLPLSADTLFTGLQSSFFRYQRFVGDLSYRGAYSSKHKFYVHLSGQYATQRLEGTELLFDPFDPEFGGEFEENVYVKQNSLFTNLEYQHLYLPAKWLQLMLGVEGQYVPEMGIEFQTSNEFGDDLAPAESNTFSSKSGVVRLHSVIQIIKGLNLTLGASTGKYDVDLPMIVSPQASIQYQMKKTMLMASFASGFRKPNKLERVVGYPQGANPNVNLGVEQSQSFELGLERELSEALKFKLNVYQLDLKKLIVPNGGFGDAVLMDSLGLQSRGLESALEFEAKNGVRSFIDFNLQLNPDSVINRPFPQCKMGLGIPIIKHLHWNVESILEGGRLLGGNRATMPYALLNTNLVYRYRSTDNTGWKSWLSLLSFSFRVFNALDHYYEHPVLVENNLNRLVPQYGRTWQAQITIDLQ